MSPAKLRMISDTSSELDLGVENYVENEIRDVVTYRDIHDGVVSFLVDSGMEILEADEEITQKRGQLLAIIKSKFVTCNGGKRLKIDGKSKIIYAIRNFKFWVPAGRNDLRNGLKMTEKNNSEVPF
jgi:hypothetical protein